MFYFIRKIIVVGAVSVICLAGAIYLSNSINFAEALTTGSATTFFGSAGAFISIYTLAVFYALFSVGAVIARIIGLVTRFGIWSALALITVIIMVSATGFAGYTITTTSIQSRLQDAMNVTLEQTYGDNLRVKLTEKLEGLPQEKMDKITSETGLTETQLLRMVDNKQYSELAKYIPKDITGIDVEAELRKRGFDPESPFIKSLFEHN